MKKQNLTVTIFISICLLAAITLLVTGGLWINAVQKRFQIEADQIREIHITNMQGEIKNSVNSLVKFIEYRKKLTESILKEDLRERVSNAESIIASIYEENNGKLPESQIKSIIVSALRNIRFNNGRGYYFIDTLAGDVVLYPTIPESEGQNLLNLQDERGNYPLQQEIELVKSQGSGYIEAYWKKPGTTQHDFKKITYVQAFEPYNWYIGTGEYVDDVTALIQEEIKEYVNQLSYGHLNSQYVFIHDMKGIEIANGLFPDMIGADSFELEDINGVKVAQEQINISQSEAQGGFLIHHWPKPDSNEVMEKLTYVTAVPDWQWVVGSGIDMHFIDQLVADKKLELEQVVQKEIYKIILLLVFIFLLSLLFAKIAVNSINKNISLFINHMEKSSSDLNTIDIETVEYNDFKNLAVVSNQMTDRINMLLYKDELTGLYNRRYINKIFTSLVDASITNEMDTSIIMIDIDYFKQINDKHGHQAGDSVLVKVAEIIQSTLRESDNVGRYGGEEIIIILPNTSNKTAFEIANRIRINIEKNDFADIHQHVTISGGICTSQTETATAMIKKADEYLYEAKENGRNRIIG